MPIQKKECSSKKKNAHPKKKNARPKKGMPGQIKYLDGHKNNWPSKKIGTGAKNIFG